MAGVPLSGVARRSPLGSGGEDPAHPLALRLSEGAVLALSDGRARLRRFRGLWVSPSKVLGGGFERHLFQGGPPSPWGASLALAPGGRWPPGARDPHGGRAIVSRSDVLGSFYPEGHSLPAHQVPCGRWRSWVYVIANRGRFGSFSGRSGSGLTQTATSIYNHTGLAGLLPSTDCIQAYQCTEQCRRRCGGWLR